MDWSTHRLDQIRQGSVDRWSAAGAVSRPGMLTGLASRLKGWLGIGLAAVGIAGIIPGVTAFGEELRRTRLEGGAIGTGFGAAVIAAGDMNGDGFPEVLVSAPAKRFSQNAVGQIFIFSGSKTGISARAAYVLDPRPGAAIGFGHSLAPMGDADGDGFADVAAGLPRHSVGGRQSGKVSLMFGNRRFPPVFRGWVVRGTRGTRNPGRYGPNLGRYLCAPGDVDGNGRPDLLASEFVMVPSTMSVEVFSLRLYPGLPHTIGTNALSVTVITNAPSRPLVLAAAGDVNGDGFCDVLVGSTPDPVKWSMQVRLFAGSPSGLQPAPLWERRQGELFSGFGSALAGAGDVDGDGVEDFLIGEPGLAGKDEFRGRVLLCTKGSGLKTHQPLVEWHTGGEQGADAFGAAVAGIGDFNGDKVDDFAVGAPGADAGKPDAGRVYVWCGRRREWRASRDGTNGAPRADLIIDGADAHGRFGTKIVRLGDLDGDGLSDFAVVSPEAPDRPGRVEVVHGIRSLASLPPARPLSAPAVTPNPDDPVEGRVRSLLKGESNSGVEPAQAPRPIESSNVVVVSSTNRPASAARTGQWHYWGGGMGLLVVGMVGGLVWRARRVRLATNSNDPVDDRAARARNLHDAVGSELIGGADLTRPEVWEGVRGALTGEPLDRSRSVDSLGAFRRELRAYAERIQSTIQIDWELEIAADQPDLLWPPVVGQHLWLATKEAMANAIRHGQARHHRVSVERVGPNLRLVIEDDGRGMPETAPERGGNGLANIQHRLRECGGSARWEQRPGGGTRVIGECPWPQLGRPGAARGPASPDR